MAGEFLHGVEVVEVDSGVRPLREGGDTVIGLVGTAASGPTDWTLVETRTDAAQWAGGTIPDALAGIQAQHGARVAVRALLDPVPERVEGAVLTLTPTGVDVGQDNIRDVVVRNTDGALAAAGDDYTVDYATGVISYVAGSLVIDSNTSDIVVSYAYTSDTPATAAAVKAAVDELSGVESLLGVRPTVLIATGWSGGVDKQSVASALLAAADSLRGVAVIDGPDTDDAAVKAYADNFDSRRGYLVDPGVKVLRADGTTARVGASGHVAGAIAKSDAERGWWHSPSNRPIRGITGTTRAVRFALGDAAAAANSLNEAQVATIIRHNGFRLWGNRSLASDRKWAFLSVARIADRLDDALLRSHLWAVDRNITKTYLDDVSEGVRAYLRELVGLGAILGGDCYPDAEANTPAGIQAGKVYFRVEFTPAYPAERVTFRQALVDTYIGEALGV